MDQVKNTETRNDGHGGDLDSEQTEGRERTPAEQADEIARKMKERATQVKTVGGRVWRGLCRWERVIVVGAIVGLSTILMPWISVLDTVTWGWTVVWETYLVIPLTFIVMLALIYFSQGASHEVRVLRSRWIIVLASMWTSVSLLGIYVIPELLTLGGMFRISASLSFGSWVFVGSIITVLVGAIKLQGWLLTPTHQDDSDSDE